MADARGSARIQRIREGDVREIAAALAEIEDVRGARAPEQRALLGALEEATPSSHALVGLTGPPGVGKSTLAGALGRHWLEGGAGVGVIAVDPSSSRSGGALLGDRARLRFPAQARAFVRSMAARDRLGGLAPATRAACVALRAAFEWTLVETVGVGQSEIDVATLVETVVLVLQPGAGDSLQFMKAGILEIPDILVVHKWDLGAPAERTRADLQALRDAVVPERAGWHPPIVGVSAHRGEGVAALAGHVERHRRHLEDSGELRRRHRASRTAWVIESLTARYGSWGLERLGGEPAARRLCEQLEGGALDVYAQLRERAQLP